MKLRRLVFPLCVAGAVSAVAAPSGPHAQGAASPETRAARVEKGLLPGIVITGRLLPVRTLAERMSSLKTPGVSVAVINGGAIEWAKGYGVLETGGSAPVTSRTLFQAASLSKSVAALAALRLVEQGKLALDQDVNERLTTWKVPENEFTKAEKVTLRRLLSHSAGLTVSGFPGYSADAAVPALVQVLDGQKPANTAAIRADVVPGTIWRYSGGGYTVDAAALAPLTGRYELRPGRVLNVVLEGGTLFVLDGLQRIELYPESATRFFDLVEEHDLEFVKGPDGAVSHLLVDGQQRVPRLPQPPAMAPSTM